MNAPYVYGNGWPVPMPRWPAHAAALALYTVLFFALRAMLLAWWNTGIVIPPPAADDVLLSPLTAAGLWLLGAGVLLRLWWNREPALVPGWRAWTQGVVYFALALAPYLFGMVTWSVIRDPRVTVCWLLLASLAGALAFPCMLRATLIGWMDARSRAHAQSTRPV